MDLFAQIQQLDFPATLPETLLAVEQHFDGPRVVDVVAATRTALEESGLLARLRPNASVAVGVGVAAWPILPLLRVLPCSAFGKQACIPTSCRPWAATAVRQLRGKSACWLTWALPRTSVGAPIRATMEVREIGQLPDGPPLYQGVDSAAADHTILISRVKPHTDFRSHLESGPAKMAVIGLGKQRGALAMHAGGGAAFQRYLAPAARVYESSTNLAGAICVVENAYDETAADRWADRCGYRRRAGGVAAAAGSRLMASLPFPPSMYWSFANWAKTSAARGWIPTSSGAC